jgi:transposase-like protein
MRDSLVGSRSASRRHRPYHRWTAGDKVAHLARLVASGLTLPAYCEQTGVPRSTLELWRREARAEGGSPFAAVEVVPAPHVAGLPSELTETRGLSGITMLVRVPGGVATELAGLDPVTTLALVRLLLATSSPSGR